MTEITSEDDLSRETDTSSSTSVFQNLERGQGVLEDRGFYDGESLSQGFKRIYGFNIFDKITASEISLLTKHSDIFNLISEQKIYHFNGLSDTFEIPKTTLRRVQTILVKRNLLNPIKWTGKAKRTFGMILLTTRDCTKEDIADYMKLTKLTDELRLDFQDKNPKNKSPAEKVVDHNQEVIELTKAKAALETEEPVFVPRCSHDREGSRCVRLSCRRK